MCNRQDRRFAVCSTRYCRAKDHSLSTVLHFVVWVVTSYQDLVLFVDVYTIQVEVTSYCQITHTTYLKIGPFQGQKFYIYLCLELLLYIFIIVNDNKLSAINVFSVFHTSIQ